MFGLVGPSCADRASASRTCTIPTRRSSSIVPVIHPTSASNFCRSVLDARRSRCSASAPARSTGPRSSCPTRRSSTERHPLRLGRGPRGGSPTRRRRAPRRAASPAPADPPHADRRAGAAPPAGLSSCCATSARCRATLDHTLWTARACGCHRRRRTSPCKPEDIPIGGLVDVLPPTCRRSRRPRATSTPQAKAAVDPRPACAPEEISSQQGDGLGLRGHPVLLQDLHPRRLPGRPVRAADPPPALPVPPVDLRPGRRRQGHLRPGRALAAAAARSPWTSEGYFVAQSDFTEPVGPSFWERG